MPYDSFRSFRFSRLLVPRQFCRHFGSSSSGLKSLTYSQILVVLRLYWESNLQFALGVLCSVLTLWVFAARRLLSVLERLCRLWQD